MAAIIVDDLRKSYDGRPVLAGVSLRVDEGSILAILGPNGAGKTTTVEILEGYRRRDGGEVSVLGHDPQRPGPSFRQEIGVVLQETRHDPYLTVSEAVDLVAGWFPSPLSTDEVLATVGLTSCADVRTAKLSGGQQRRLDVALGLVGRPRLLFLDEPTTGFDPSARREAWAAISRLRDRGTTIVLTTHYLDEAATLADDIAVLAHNRVVATGTPGTIAGRDRFTHITFRLENDVVGDPPEGGDVTGAVWRSTVDDVTGAMHDLSRWAADRDTRLHDLTVERPSLEDIYLELIT
jgi:ABC-2 type transport system ATP-binding protein